MENYIWQKLDWQSGSAPEFRWNAAMLDQHLGQLQGALVDFMPPDSALMPDVQMQVHIDSLVQTALHSSEIEGEVLDAGSVRSSVVNKLGLERAGVGHSGTAQTDALAELLITATSDLDQQVTLSMLCEWQAALFVNTNPLSSINIGDLRGDEPMRGGIGSTGSSSCAL